MTTLASDTATIRRLPRSAAVIVASRTRILPVTGGGSAERPRSHGLTVPRGERRRLVAEGLQPLPHDRRGGPAFLLQLSSLSSSRSHPADG